MGHWHAIGQRLSLAMSILPVLQNHCAIAMLESHPQLPVNSRSPCCSWLQAAAWQLEPPETLMVPVDQP